MRLWNFIFNTWFFYNLLKLAIKTLVFYNCIIIYNNKLIKDKYL